LLKVGLNTIKQTNKPMVGKEEHLTNNFTPAFTLLLFFILSGA
jgi:hypothetical protein